MRKKEKGIYRRFWMGWLIEFVFGGVDEGGWREEVGGRRLAWLGF